MSNSDMNGQPVPYWAHPVAPAAPAEYLPAGHTLATPPMPPGTPAAAMPPASDGPGGGRYGASPGVAQPMAPAAPPAFLGGALPVRSGPQALQWTVVAEEQFKAVEKQAAELRARRALALEKVREAFDGTRLAVGLDVDAIIRRADAIRDALAPFDSGVRPAEFE